MRASLEVRPVCVCVLALVGEGEGAVSVHACMCVCVRARACVCACVGAVYVALTYTSERGFFNVSRHRPAARGLELNMDAMDATSPHKRRRTAQDCVVLDVGGTLFKSTISTLTSSCTYFASLFSHEWAPASESREIYLDRDPDAFKVLLSCLRNHVALLPETDPDLCKRRDHRGRVEEAGEGLVDAAVVV